MNEFSRASQRNWGTRVREYIYHGMRLVVLENEALRIGVLAGKGADIVELNYKPRDLDLVWLSPAGVRNPAEASTTYHDPLATFVETYPGGWQEIFPNGGMPCTWDGAQYGQHDEVFGLAWDVAVIEDTGDAVAVRFTVRTRKVPCVIEKTVRLTAGSPHLRFDERLVNTGPVPIRAMWGHHITFGQPFLRPGHRIQLPDGIQVVPHPGAIAPGGRRVANVHPFDWPHAQGADGTDLDLSIIPEQGSPSDIVYLTGFEDQAWYEVTDPDAGVGSRVEWDGRQMPFLWFWQEFGATTGYPWYGQNYNIGLEPFSSYPTNGLSEAVENGTALRLKPGQVRRFWLTMTVRDSKAGDSDG